MPYRDGQFYPEPILISGGQLAPTLKTADETLTAFDTGGVRDMLATLNIHEHVTTALTGTNNDLTFIARTAGTTPTVRVTYVDPSANSATLGVVVASQDITVNLATGSGGAITSTAAQVKAAIAASTAANALVVVELASGNDGTGVVTAMSQQTLVGPTGTSPTMDVKLQSSVDGGTSYFDVASFSQKTVAAVEGKLFTAIGTRSRWVLDIGGTTPVFAISIAALVRQ
jgi:hypothetical protein